MTRERIERPSRPVSFTRRELEVLQGLVDGLGKKEISRKLHIPLSNYNIFTRLIAEKCSESNRAIGLRKAIVVAVTYDLLDFSNLPGRPSLSLSGREVQVLAATVRGIPTGEVCDFLGISKNSFSSYRDGVYRKLGVATAYQAVAWGAREIKRSGGELSFGGSYLNYLDKP